MSAPNKVTKKPCARAPKLKVGTRLHEFLTKGMNAAAGLSSTFSITAHADVHKRAAFYGMLQQVSRVDESRRNVKKSSTSMALVGLDIGTGERKALRCLLKLPKDKLRILGQALPRKALETRSDQQVP